MNKKIKRFLGFGIALLCAVGISVFNLDIKELDFLNAYLNNNNGNGNSYSNEEIIGSLIDTKDIYVEINNNIPNFSDEDKVTKKSFENYSELDYLERPGVAYAKITTKVMPTEDRGSIGHVKPAGWQTVKYDVVDGKYLYNRCHLIGFQLAGENANEKNLITGTRYFNVEGMLPFENKVADYVKETNNSVLYRVTPIYENENLVASGVTIEAYSIEDKGEGVCFNVYIPNSQPGVYIEYSNGDSCLEN